MKNAVIFSGYFSPHVGGLEVAVENLAYHMGRTGSVAILARLPYWDVGKVFPIPKPWALWRLRKYSGDVVITNTRFFVSSLIGLVFAKLKGLPLVHIEHGSCHPVVNSSILSVLAKAYDHTLGSLVVRSAGKVICQSEKARRFLEHLGAKNIVVLPLTSVDLDLFNADRRAWHNGMLNIAVVARPIFAKGLQDVVDILPEIQSTVPNARLTIVSNIRHDDVPLALSTTDLLVHPSYSEGGVAYPILEAGAMGIPAVVSDVGGVRDVFRHGETALIYPSGDREALKDCLLQMLRNRELRQRVGTSAKQVVEQRYNMDRVCRAIEEVIES